MAGKIIIMSAPSGCGKSTIISALMAGNDLDMQFSVSATSRSPREGEVDGVHYYFLTEEEFRDHIVKKHFVEYEEVYPGRFYGTLISEIERITSSGHNVILDIDVKGAMNVKRIYGDQALALFILPPSIEVLRQRLESRATDSAEAINERVNKAEYELSFAKNYDKTVINDNLEVAVKDAHDIIKSFIGA